MSTEVKIFISCVNLTNICFEVPTCPESLVTFLAEVLFTYVCVFYMSRERVLFYVDPFRTL